MAVEAFFIISGFYMSLILEEKYAPENFRLFMSNRLLRLFPVYWAVLIAAVIHSLVIHKISGGRQFPVVEQYLSVPVNGGTLFFLCIVNLFIVGQDLVMFLGVSPATGQLFLTANFWQTSHPLYTFLFIPQAWSLGLELLFYCCAPWFVRLRTKWLGICIFLSLGLRLYLYCVQRLDHDPWTYRFFPTELVFFLAGCLSYRFYRNMRERSCPRIVYRLILAFVLAATGLFGYVPESLPWVEPVYFLVVAASIPFVFRYLKNNKADNQVGQLSYPMYISHLLVAASLNALPFRLFRESWVIVAATIVVSFLLDVTIARPIEKYRQGRVRRPAGKLIPLQLRLLRK